MHTYIHTLVMQQEVCVSLPRVNYHTNTQTRLHTHKHTHAHHVTHAHTSTHRPIHAHTLTHTSPPSQHTFKCTHTHTQTSVAISIFLQGKRSLETRRSRTWFTEACANCTGIGLHRQAPMVHLSENSNLGYWHNTFPAENNCTVAIVEAASRYHNARLSIPGRFLAHIHN